MKNGEKQKIPQEEHLVDVRKSANMGHLRDENHLIDVHLAEMWAPEEEGLTDIPPIDDLSIPGGAWLDVCFCLYETDI